MHQNNQEEEFMFFRPGSKYQQILDEMELDVQQPRRYSFSSCPGARRLSISSNISCFDDSLFLGNTTPKLHTTKESGLKHWDHIPSTSSITNSPFPNNTFDWNRTSNSPFTSNGFASMAKGHPSIYPIHEVPSTSNSSISNNTFDWNRTSNSPFTSTKKNGFASMAKGHPSISPIYEVPSTSNSTISTPQRSPTNQLFRETTTSNDLLSTPNLQPGDTFEHSNDISISPHLKESIAKEVFGCLHYRKKYLGYVCRVYIHIVKQQFVAQCFYLDGISLYVTMLS